MSGGNLSIIDPTNSQSASVNSRGELKVSASSEPQAVAEAILGGSFIITTGSLNLTSANYSHILYLKNTEDVNWVVNAITGTFGATNGTGDVLVQFTINPTGGTLITSGTDLVPNNLNLGSAKLLTGTFKTGVEGSTISGGGSPTPALVPEGLAVHQFPAKPLIIAPGNGIAVGVKPPSGNTSMNVQIQIPVYREGE